jgi:hypothetical protein
MKSVARAIIRTLCSKYFMPVSKRFKVVSVKENGGGLCVPFRN